MIQTRLHRLDCHAARCRAALVSAVVAMSAASGVAAQEVAFPLDAAAEGGLRLCAASCDGSATEDALRLTVRGGRDAGPVRYFTPRLGDETPTAPAVGARVSAFGFGLEGAVAQGADRERVSLGAAFEADGWSVGGGLSFDVESDSDENGDSAAQVGVDFLVSPGVSVGGGLRVSEDRAAAERNVEAGLQMRLDF
jgi:hypothetical protein